MEVEMKVMTVLAMATSALIAAASTSAQETTVQPGGQKTLAATMNVYVFPTTGQTPGQQSTDEAACYGWAVQNTGTDPFDLAKQTQANEQQAAQAQQQAETVGQGAGAAGAVRGAAVGALIGEIASDDAGKGAAYGAAAGLVSGRRHARQARSQAQAQAKAQADQAKQFTAEQLENFKKAFSVCLEAKSYLVKY
jgi:hypothetical protein